MSNVAEALKSIFKKPLSWAIWLVSAVSSRLENPSIYLFLLLTIIVLGIHHLCILYPRLSWLPGGSDAGYFLQTLWQVHAAVMALSVIVVTIFVTVLANQADRSRTWRLYSGRTKIVTIIWLNLIMLGSEGLAVLQVNEAGPAFLALSYAENFIPAEFLFFVISLIAFAWLFKETLNFIDEDYVESLAEGRILSRMSGAVDADLNRQRQRRQLLTGRVPDEADRS